MNMTRTTNAVERPIGFNNIVFFSSENSPVLNWKAHIWSVDRKPAS